MLQTRGVCSDDVHTVDHTTKTNGIEHLSGSIGVEALADSHQNQTKGSEADHDAETFSSTPEIKQLGSWDVDSGSHGVRDDVDDRQKGVFFEGAGNVWRKIAGDG